MELFVVANSKSIVSTFPQWRRQLWGTGARALSPRFLTISFLFHFRVNLTNYTSLV